MVERNVKDDDDTRKVRTGSLLRELRFHLYPRLQLEACALESNHIFGDFSEDRGGRGQAEEEGEEQGYGL